MWVARGGVVLSSPRHAPRKSSGKSEGEICWLPSHCLCRLAFDALGYNASQAAPPRSLPRLRIGCAGETQRMTPGRWHVRAPIDCNFVWTFWARIRRRQSCADRREMDGVGMNTHLAYPQVVGSIIQELTGGRPYVFTIMPYEKSAATELYTRFKRIIEKEFGLACLPADDVRGSGHDLLEKIHLLVERAEVVVAGISEG